MGRGLVEHPRPKRVAKAWSGGAGQMTEQEGVRDVGRVAVRTGTDLGGSPNRVLEVPGLLPGRERVASNLGQRVSPVAVRKLLTDNHREVRRGERVARSRAGDGHATGPEHRVPGQGTKAGEQRARVGVERPKVAQRAEEQRVGPEKVELAQVAKRPLAGAVGGLAEYIGFEHGVLVLAGGRVCGHRPEKRRERGHHDGVTGVRSPADVAGHDLLAAGIGSRPTSHPPALFS
jgi:hypothetical protein